jgi:succinate dehydrogenase/fumarate reductase flavoprotein subunit
MFNSPSIEKADVTVDVGVLVMGSGIAGLTAAIKAKTDKPDVRVVLIEKMELTGGSTRMADSWFYLPVDDTAAAKADAVKYLKERGRNNVDMTLINHWADNCRTVYKFLKGNTANPTLTLASGTDPVQHLVMFDSSTRGRGLVDTLIAKALDLGVTVLTGVKGTELITKTTASGVEVVGAKAESIKGSKYTFNATGGVILATGGFGWNKDLLREFTPQTANDDSNSHPGNTGDGIIMGRNIGAALVFYGAKVGFGTREPGTFLGLDGPSGSRTIASDGDYIPYTGTNDVRQAEPAGTNIDGHQHDTLDAVTYEVRANVDNNVNYRWMVEKRAATPGVKFWNPSATSPAQSLIDGGWAFTSTTIADLASKIGMDAVLLQDAFDGVGVSTVGQVTVRSVYPSDLGTFGGLKININGQVLGDGTKGTTADQPIPGLYAAGETASGQFYYVEYPASGLSLSTSSTIGYFAGAHAAARIPTP